MQLRTRDRLSRTLRETDTWLVVGSLALAGWTFDSLQMALAMHGDLRSNVGAFLAHFWFVVPMLVAIVILTRLHPKARLLGIAAYDQSGRLLETQGQPCLEKMTAGSVVTALRSRDQPGLHSVLLPSGQNVYFLPDSGLTLALCFDNPASMRDVMSNARAMRAQLGPLVTIDLLGDLDPGAKVLAASMLSSPLLRHVVEHFQRNPHTAMTGNDIAGWVRASGIEVIPMLDQLADLGLLERQIICDDTFFRLSRDPGAAEQTEALFQRLEEWQTTLDRLESTLGPMTSVPEVRRSAGGWPSNPHEGNGTARTPASSGPQCSER